MSYAHAEVLANQSHAQAKVCIKQKSLIRRGKPLTQRKGAAAEREAESLSCPGDQ